MLKYTPFFNPVISNRFKTVLALCLFCFVTSYVVAQAPPPTYCDGLPGDWPAALSAAGPLGTHIVDRANVSDNSDNQFTEGSQDPDLMSELTWNLGNVNDKTDITNAGAILDGCYLRFFGDRTADNGDAAIGFWFYKDPNVSLNSDGSFSGVHMDGDLLIVSKFTGGGGTATPTVYVWQNNTLVEITTATGCSKTNTARIASPWAYQSKFDEANFYPTGTFFEGYVNICGIPGVDACFTNFLLETRNSQAINASLQDLVFGDFDTKPSVTMDDQTVCEGGTVTFTANVTGGLAPITYSFNGGSFTNDNTFEITNATITQTVTVVARGANGCESEPVQATLTVTDIPDIQAHNTTICEGGSIDLASLIDDAGGGTITFHTSQADAESGANAIDPTTVSPPNGANTYFVRSAVTVNNVVCYGTTSVIVNVTDKPDITADNATICEGGSIDLSTLITEDDGSTITFHTSQADADNGVNAVGPTVSPTNATNTYFVRSTVTVNNVVCYGTTTLTVNVVACSKVVLKKLTNNVVDGTQQWTFAIYEGPLGYNRSPQVVVANETTSSASSTLFSGVTLSALKTYTLCELVSMPTAGWDQVWMIDTDGDGDGDVAVDAADIYNPDGAEDNGNRCVEIGFGTDYSLPTNTSTNPATWLALNFVVNNVPPPGGDARTPGYWKNWNTCSKSNGKQAQKAHDKGFFILDDHLPITLWANANVVGTSYTACSSQPLSYQFVLRTCASAVRLLNTQDVNGKNMASDAAYTLAKHLLAYLLNKASNTYACAQADAAAAEARALLASICFNGSGSYLDSKVRTSAAIAKRNRALYLANILDQYNNNTLNCTVTINNIVGRQTLAQASGADAVTELKVSALPNPYNDRVRFVIESPVSGRGNLSVFNMLGQKMQTVYEGHVNAGKGQVVEYSVPQHLRSNLIYVMQVGNYRVTGKLVRASK